MAVLDSTATSVPLPGQHNQTADPRVHGAVARPCLPDLECAVLKDHVRGARTDANAGRHAPSTLALPCTKAASTVTADTILEDIYARI